MGVFWYVAPCSLVEICRRFRGTCKYLQPRRHPSSYLSNLKSYVSCNSFKQNEVPVLSGSLFETKTRSRYLWFRHKQVTFLLLNWLRHVTTLQSYLTSKHFLNLNEINLLSEKGNPQRKSPEVTIRNPTILHFYSQTSVTWRNRCLIYRGQGRPVFCKAGEAY
jgi:hypothetical protein